MPYKTFTVHEAADYLNVHPDTVYSMVREKQIPHFRVRKRIFFTQSAIDEWIKRQEQMVDQMIAESLSLS